MGKGFSFKAATSAIISARMSSKKECEKVFLVECERACRVGACKDCKHCKFSATYTMLMSIDDESLNRHAKEVGYKR